LGDGRALDHLLHTLRQNETYRGFIYLIRRDGNTTRLHTLRQNETDDGGTLRSLFPTVARGTVRALERFLNTPSWIAPLPGSPDPPGGHAEDE
jgi:hypothetical protein